MEWLQWVSPIAMAISLLANIVMFKSRNFTEERKELEKRLDRQRDELNKLDFQMRDGLHERLSKEEFRDYKKETAAELHELRGRR